MSGHRYFRRYCQRTTPWRVPPRRAARHIGPIGRVHAVVLALLLGVAASSPVQAQGSGPKVRVIPAGGTYPTDSVSNVKIEWCSSAQFDASTRTIELNGVSVASRFTTANASIDWNNNGVLCVYGQRSTGTLVLRNHPEGA